MAKKHDIRQVDQLAAKHGLLGPWRGPLGNAIEAKKESAGLPSWYAFSWSELNEIAEQFKVDHDIS